MTKFDLDATGAAWGLMGEFYEDFEETSEFIRFTTKIFLYKVSVNFCY